MELEVECRDHAEVTATTAQHPEEDGFSTRSCGLTYYGWFYGVAYAVGS